MPDYNIPGFTPYPDVMQDLPGVPPDINQIVNSLAAPGTPTGGTPSINSPNPFTASNPDPALNPNLLTPGTASGTPWTPDKEAAAFAKNTPTAANPFGPTETDPMRPGVQRASTDVLRELFPGVQYGFMDMEQPGLGQVIAPPETPPIDYSLNPNLLKPGETPRLGTDEPVPGDNGIIEQTPATDATVTPNEPNQPVETPSVENESPAVEGSTEQVVQSLTSPAPSGDHIPTFSQGSQGRRTRNDEAYYGLPDNWFGSTQLYGWQRDQSPENEYFFNGLTPEAQYHFMYGDPQTRRQNIETLLKGWQPPTGLTNPRG